MAVEAVIWDFGGVFTTSPFEAFARFEAERGLPRDFIRRVNSANPHENAWALFERNLIDAARFDRLFLEESAALGHPANAVAWLANTLGVHGIALEAGEVVLSGSLAIMVPVVAGNTLRVTIGGIGGCSVRFI